MSGHLQPIKLDSYKPLRELVCENIRQAIIDGTFSPGERLMEIQLADEMGVSRTPVREAIRKLELEGFVVMIPRRVPMLPIFPLKISPKFTKSVSALIFWLPVWLPSVLRMRSLNSLTVILSKLASISPTMIWIKSSK